MPSSLHAFALLALAGAELKVERVSTKVPFPRGLQLVDGQLYVISRGRVRDYGGVSAEIDDRAGTLFRVNPSIAEPYSAAEPSDAIRANGDVAAEPTSPPFRLWDRSSSPAWKDRETDRPYCGLSWHPESQNFFICAFSGIDRDEKTGKSFTKNLSDAILRFDLRSKKWYDVERHDSDKGGIYPHNDPAGSKPPYGWLNGPDNCLALGNWLYAVAKDNSRLVRYDLTEIIKSSDAGTPKSFPVFEEEVYTSNAGKVSLQGHSALAFRDGWLYVGTRTSGHIVRLKLAGSLAPEEPLIVDLVGLVDPYDPNTKKSANLTDMSFGPDGSLYFISASPARCYRFNPDPKNICDFRAGRVKPYVDLAELTKNPKMKSENLLVDKEGKLYITSGDAYSYHAGSGGVVWRVSFK